MARRRRRRRGRRLVKGLLGGLAGLIFDRGPAPRPPRRARSRPRREDRPRARSPRQDTEDLARRLERGEIRGEALRDLFGRGVVRVKNPVGDILEAARELARRFHGTDRRQVVELEERERNAPRYAVVVGQVEAIEYRPLPPSGRAGAVYRHEAGDRGPLKERARGRMLLVADPETGRPYLAQHRSGMRLTERGLEG